MPPLLRAWERLPVELWGYILDYTIDSTLLLTLNHYSTSLPLCSTLRQDWICPMYEIDDFLNVYWGMKDQVAMREFRLLRARMREVCRSWKEFVDSPAVEHRIVRLCPSGGEGQITSKMLVKSRRLEMLDPLKDPSLPPRGVIKEALDQGLSFETRIVLDIGGFFSHQILKNHVNQFSDLQTLFLDFSSVPHVFLGDTLSYLPSLTSLYLVIEPTCFLPDETFRLPNLRTLDIMSSQASLPSLSFATWSFPLRHLRLWSLDSMEFFRLLYVLPNIGSNLRYLSLDIQGNSRTGISCLWTACPQLACLEIPVRDVLVCLPPEGYTLKHLVNTYHQSIAFHAVSRNRYSPGSMVDFFAKVVNLYHRCPQLQTITDSHLWKWHENFRTIPLPPISEGLSRSLGSEENDVLTLLARKCFDLGVRYEDKDRCTYGDAVAMHLKLTGKRVAF